MESTSKTQGVIAELPIFQGAALKRRQSPYTAYSGLQRFFKVQSHLRLPEGTIPHDTRVAKTFRGPTTGLT